MTLRKIQMCPVDHLLWELGPCPEACPVHPTPATPSIVSYVSLGGTQQPRLCSLSLPVHPSFLGRALCDKHYPSTLLQGLLWDALSVHDHHAHRYSPHRTFCSLLSWPRRPLGRFGHRLEPSEEACEQDPHPSNVSPTHPCPGAPCPQGLPTFATFRLLAPVRPGSRSEHRVLEWGQWLSTLGAQVAYSFLFARSAKENPR